LGGEGSSMQELYHLSFCFSFFRYGFVLIFPSLASNSDPLTSASQVAEITDMCHYVLVMVCFPGF
jgi:hypothetical protein